MLSVKFFDRRDVTHFLGDYKGAGAVSVPAKNIGLFIVHVFVFWENLLLDGIFLVLDYLCYLHIKWDPKMINQIINNNNKQLFMNIYRI